MAPAALESDRVSLVGFDSLDGYPPFKIDIDRVDGRWYLYLGHFFYSGWSIVDVTDPADPELVRFIEGPPNTVTKQIQVADGLMVTALERPYAGYGPVDDPMDPTQRYTEGAYFWDVEADPTDPTLLSHYETGGTGTHRNYYAGGDYAYLVAWPEEFSGGMLTVVDVSDPGAIEAVGQWWWPGQHPDDDAEDSEHFYFHGPAYIQDDRAYTAYGRVGAVTLDVSDPTDPTFMNRIGVPRGLGSYLGVHSYIPVPDTDIAVANTEAINESSPTQGGEPLNYTFLIDVSNERATDIDPETGAPIGPKVISSLPLPQPEPHLPYDNYYEKGGRSGPHNQHHYRGEPTRYRSNDRLVMTWFNAGLRIFDISDPLAPTEAGYYVPEDPERRIGSRPSSALVSHFEDVAVDSRGYIYCSDPNHGLFVLESELL